MKRVLRVFPVLVAIMLVAQFTGCEWDTGSESDRGSDVGIDVSGVYNQDQGLPIATTAAYPTSMAQEEIGVGDGVRFGFEDTVSSPIVQDTVIVRAETSKGLEIFSDGGGSTNGSSSLVSNMGGSGVVNYNTGQIVAMFAVEPLAGAPVIAEFQLQGEAGSTLGIYQFVVHHVAGTLEVQDNNGDTYRGTITQPSVDYDSGTPVVDALAGGVPGDADAGLVREIELSYAYSLSGTSGGVPVKMVGTFRIAIVVTYSYELEGGAGGFSLSVEEVFQQRTLLMQGNWIETVIYWNAIGEFQFEIYFMIITSILAMVGVSAIIVKRIMLTKIRRQIN